MNNAQRIVLMVYFASLIFAGAYLPMIKQLPEGGAIIRHDWAWNWDYTESSGHKQYVPNKVATDILVFKFLIATGLCGMLFVITSDKNFILMLIHAFIAMIVIGLLTFLVIKFRSSTGG